jgi:hypothetical protein
VRDGEIVLRTWKDNEVDATILGASFSGIVGIGWDEIQRILPWRGALRPDCTQIEHLKFAISVREQRRALVDTLKPRIGVEKRRPSALGALSGDGQLFFQLLFLVETGVVSVQRKELFVPADFDDTAMIEHCDLLGILHR